MVSRPRFWSRSRSHSSRSRSRSHEVPVSVSWELVSRSLTAEVSEPTQQTQPPAKKQKQSLFGRYKVTSTQSTSTTSQDKTLAEVLTNYLQMIGVTEMQLSEVFKMEQFSSICPLLERVLCVPVSSAPVERVFSQSGLVMKPNRARMCDSLLEELVFLKCNDC